MQSLPADPKNQIPIWIRILSYLAMGYSKIGAMYVHQARTAEIEILMYDNSL
jgi:hypothetical protein